MQVTTYVRLRRKIALKENEQLYVTDFVTFSSVEVEAMFRETIISLRYKTTYDRYFVIDGIRILNELKRLAPNYHFELIGPTETVVNKTKEKKRASYLLFVFVWILLFVGTAMTIINFHYDVSMQEVHEKIHYIFTGEHHENPLWIQIPYSFGLGIGMFIFLNRLWKKRINDEPSPLEIEIFKYDRDIDDFIVSSDKNTSIKEENDY
ncbi:MAG TPA: stage V sporulation protein AA [Pseudogracilibacillus sp.]|nr:stage V sporulation protein AA [Pseudogracilibacillus sp.]